MLLTPAIQQGLAQLPAVIQSLFDAPTQMMTALLEDHSENRWSSGPVRILHRWRAGPVHAETRSCFVQF